MPRVKPRKAREVFQGDGPTPEQIARTPIERRFVTHAETATKSMAHVTAHSPVLRWENAGRLSDSQLAAIRLCEGLWETCGLKQRVTANYGERLPPGGDNEWIAVREIQARDDLARIEGYVLPWMWDWFENVVRWGETAGSAGEALGFSGSKASQAASLAIVKAVAGMIAQQERLT